MKVKDYAKITQNNKFYKTNPSGISLIVLVITIIVIIILAAAIILTLNNNNPISEANKARYESDVANIQAIFTNVVTKVMAQNQSTIEVKAGSLNSVKNGGSSTEGRVNYTLDNPLDSSNENGVIIFNTGTNNATTYYTGKMLPLYNAGETTWYVDNEGVISLKVGLQEYGKGEIEGEEIATSDNPMLQSWATDRKTDFHADEYRTKITKVKFETNVKIPNSKIMSWDVSKAKDKSVMAWVEDDGAEGYILTIAGKEKIVANTNSSYLFANFSKLEKIENIELLDIIEKTTMRNAFSNCKNLKSMNFSNCDTSKIKDFTDIFSYCSALESIGENPFDISGAVGITSALQLMFTRCYKLTTTINVKGKVNVYSYTNAMFESTSTSSSAKITLNYTSESESAVDDIISRYTTNTTPSNIVKGIQLD